MQSPWDHHISKREYDKRVDEFFQKEQERDSIAEQRRYAIDPKQPSPDLYTSAYSGQTGGFVQDLISRWFDMDPKTRLILNLAGFGIGQQAQGTRGHRNFLQYK